MSEKRKMKLRYRIIIWSVLILLALVLMLFIGGYLVFRHYYGKLNYIPLDTTEEIIFSIPDETDDFPDVTTDIKTPDTAGTHGTEAPVTGVPVTDPNVTGHSTDAPIITDPVITTKAPEPVEKPKGTDKRISFSKNVINILLVGTDGRTVTERGRSDTMILISINKDTKQIVITSFLRDIYLYIPTVETDNRLNASYAFGGTSLLLKTLKANFGITIDKYVRTNFQSFEKIIDIVGGVDVELDQAEIDHLNLKNATPGVVHLNGSQALSYCRIRKIDKGSLLGDFGRTYRQREVLGQLFEKSKKLSMSEINTLLNELLPLVTTNLTQSEILGIVANAFTYMKYDLVKNRIPADGTYKYVFVRKMSVVSIDFDKNIDLLEKTIKGTK